MCHFAEIKAWLARRPRSLALQKFTAYLIGEGCWQPSAERGGAHGEHEYGTHSRPIHSKQAWREAEAGEWQVLALDSVVILKGVEGWGCCSV